MPIPKIGVYHTGDSMEVSVPAPLLDEFKEMIRKATNCWPDASPEMKTFADRVLHGGPLQDYRAQSQTGKSRPE